MTANPLIKYAYAWLAERPEIDLSRFVLIGASVGCSIALDYAAKDKSVDGVVCLTPGMSYLGLDSAADAQKYGRRPLLLLACESERAAADELGRIVPGSTVKIFPAPAAPGSPAAGSASPPVGGGSSAGNAGSAGGDRISPVAAGADASSGGGAPLPGDVASGAPAGDPQALHGTRMFGKAANIERTIAAFAAQAAGPPSREVVVGSLKGQVYYAPESSQAPHLSKRNVRRFSSAAEAEQRGLRPPKSASGRSSGSRSRTRAQPHAPGEAFPEKP